MNVFVDTQIWVYAFKRPSKEKIPDETLYNRALKMHEKARELIRRLLVEDTIYITAHQLAEIYHALAFRGVKMSIEEAHGIVEKLARSSKTVIVEVKRKHYREALRHSSLTGIHVWDYLCVIPLRNLVDIAYTNDKHFLHPSLSSMIPRIENPVGEWLEL